MNAPNHQPAPAPVVDVSGDEEVRALIALMASRLCHDLINPVGALSSGLEVIADPGHDAAMHEEALDLVRKSADKAVALLKFARLAYGSAGGPAARIAWEDAHAALSGLFGWSRAELVWNIPPGDAPKDEAQALLAFAQAAGDCVPRGGQVIVSADAPGRYSVVAEGGRIMVQADLASSLNGDAAELKPRFTPVYLAGRAARQRGGMASIDHSEDRLTLRLGFSRI